MKSYREVLILNVPHRMDFVNITPKVDAAVKKSGVKEGLVLVNSMHRAPLKIPGVLTRLKKGVSFVDSSFFF